MQETMGKPSGFDQTIEGTIEIRKTITPHL